MKAKTVNFERGRDTKRAIGIGGIDPLKDFKRDFQELWKNTVDVFKSLEGKTISAEMTKTWMDKKYMTQQEFAEFTIKVDKIFNNNIEIMNQHDQNIRPAIYIIASDGFKYIYKGDSKINIHP